ncbi:MAG: hypothetical protein HC822_07960 [Oscillochloris sp.]|nr:hypothetical protein [Oscillochloris sp.]
MSVLEDRAAWEAAFRAGWLAHYEETGTADWKRYNRPTNQQAIGGPGVDLAASRLLLISSAGGYIAASQKAFDAENNMGDYTIRRIPMTTDPTEIAFAHTHYDHTAVDSDQQVLVPLGHLNDLVRAGTIGALTPNMISFMGYQPDVSRVLDTLIPAVVAAAKAEGAQAALLVPS